MSEYFTYTNLLRGSLARASEVNQRFQAVETGLALLPASAKLKEGRVGFYSAGGTGNALTVTMSPAISAYTAGLTLVLALTATNSGAATLNVNGLGAIAIKRVDGSALGAGDLASGEIAEVTYDGTVFRLQRQTTGEIAGYVTTCAASAAAAAASAAAAAASAALAAGYASAAAASAATAVSAAASINDSNLVHRTGTESVGGAKTFSSTIVASAGITINGQTLDTLSANGCSLIEASDYAAMKALLGLTIGTNVQAYDADLTAIAGLTSAADKLPYFTGSGTAGVADFSAFGRSLVDDADATAARATLGLVIGTNVQAYDAELAAIAALTSAADRLPYFNGSGTATLATFTSAGRALVDDADASAQLTTLGFSTFGKTIIDDADGAAVRTTIGAAGSGLATGSGLTMATARLLGRSTASTGAIEEISVSGMTLTGGVLSPTNVPIAGTLASDTAYSSGVLTTAASVTLGAGTYRVRVYGSYTASATTAALIAGLSLSAPNPINGTFKIFNNNVAGAPVFVPFAGSLGSVSATGSTATAATTEYALMADFDCVSSGTTISLQFARSGTGTITVKSGAIIVAEKIT